MSKEFDDFDDFDSESDNVDVQRKSPVDLHTRLLFLAYMALNSFTLDELEKDKEKKMIESFGALTSQTWDNVFFNLDINAFSDKTELTKSVEKVINETLIMLHDDGKRLGDLEIKLNNQSNQYDGAEQISSRYSGPILASQVTSSSSSSSYQPIQTNQDKKYVLSSSSDDDYDYDNEKGEVYEW